MIRNLIQADQRLKEVVYDKAQQLMSKDAIKEAKENSVNEGEKNP